MDVTQELDIKIKSVYFKTNKQFKTFIQNVDFKISKNLELNWYLPGIWGTVTASE